MEVVEFGRLSAEQRTELEGDEVDPFDMRRIDVMLRWRAKDRHVTLRGSDGRLVASVGLLVADIRVGDGPLTPAVGIGGVIVAAPYRGQGLASRVIVEALGRAATLGPELSILFCHRDRVGLYERHGFTSIEPPVLVAQPDGFVEAPQVSMWRPLREGVLLPAGRVTLHSPPF